MIDKFDSVAIHSTMFLGRSSFHFPSFRLILLGSFFSFLLFFFYSTPLSPKLRHQSSCSPRDYADGKWVFYPRTNANKMTAPDDAIRFSGFQGCASSREFFWHLASDRENQWDRFPAAHSWQWSPGPDCKGMSVFHPQALLKHLVEDGGWLLVGDSVTENHFFSLSCILYPHVLGYPDYSSPAHFDRAQIQHLYLNPDSPLVNSLHPPAGFNITQTPLVSFRRVDLLLTQKELIAMYHTANPDAPKDFEMFSDEATWTLSPSVYLEQFTAPLPESNYRTMVVSTAGHWTTNLFRGFWNETKNEDGFGMDRLIEFFEAAMSQWANEVQTTLQEHERAGNGKRRAVVRAYLPGHEDCHDHRIPWIEIQPFVWNWWNWANIKDFNKVFEKVLSARRLYPDVHFLPIDRPGRLRPDAHASGDCLHIMTGAGVLEGWSEYIWHFVKREV
jgi:hypothetical protein